MRGALRRAVGVALVAVSCSAVPAGAAPVRLSAVGDEVFPSRSFLVTLGTDQRLGADAVRVTENGQPVVDPVVEPLARPGAGFGTVLVIDTSESLHQEGIDLAMSAARAFAASRDPSQPLGVVMFDGVTRASLALTTDRVAINRALAKSPALGRGTHIYDGVTTASRLLRVARLRAGAIIVLSDGGDTGSQASQADAVAAARRASARVYSVGLLTPSYTPKTLTALAAAAGGTYTSAGSQESLTGLYKMLGTELSRQYIITYRSLSSLGTTVNVKATVRGQGTGTVRYFTPALPQSAPPRPKARDTFWASGTATVLVPGLGALLTLFAVLGVIRARRNLRQRVGDFVTVPIRADERAWSSAMVDRALGVSEVREGRFGRWAISADDLDLARIAMPPGQLLLVTVGATILTAWTFIALTGSAGGLLFALPVPVLVRLIVLKRIAAEQRRFGDQLHDNLQVIASAMRAGHTFLGALGVVVNDAPDPSRREFRRVLADEQLGVPLADALTLTAKRMKSRDFEHVALVAVLQAETGGNTAEVVDRVAETIRERSDVRRLVRSLTAQGRLAGFVVSCLPVFVAMVISVMAPGYLDPLFEHPAGIALIVLATLMITSGALLIRKIVNIDV